MGSLHITSQILPSYYYRLQLTKRVHYYVNTTEWLQKILGATYIKCILNLRILISVNSVGFTQSRQQHSEENFRFSCCLEFQWSDYRRVDYILSRPGAIVKKRFVILGTFYIDPDSSHSTSNGGPFYGILGHHKCNVILNALKLEDQCRFNSFYTIDLRS